MQCRKRKFAILSGPAKVRVETIIVKLSTKLETGSLNLFIFPDDIGFA
jgi:hypothetical protein